MNKFVKFIAGSVLCLSLLCSGIFAPEAKAQATLNYVTRTAFHITSATTTTAIASDAYIVSVVIATSSVGTAFAVKVQNKEGTAKILMATPSSPAVGTQVLNLGGERSAVYMKGGIDIVSTGTPGVIDVFITYYKP